MKAFASKLICTTMRRLLERTQTLLFIFIRVIICSMFIWKRSNGHSHSFSEITRIKGSTLGSISWSWKCTPHAKAIPHLSVYLGEIFVEYSGKFLQERTRQHCLWQDRSGNDSNLACHLLLHGVQARMIWAFLNGREK